MKYRKTLVPYFESDNALLGRLTGVDYSDWPKEKGRGPSSNASERGQAGM